MSHILSERYDSIKNRQTSAIRSFESDSYHILDIEIDDHGIRACSNGVCDFNENNIVLLKYNEIPDFLKGNPYVLQGYRSMLPFSSCLKRYLGFLHSNKESVTLWAVNSQKTASLYLFL